jgi:hypothetical protein
MELFRDTLFLTRPSGDAESLGLNFGRSLTRRIKASVGQEVLVTVERDNGKLRIVAEWDDHPAPGNGA